MQVPSLLGYTSALVDMVAFVSDDFLKTVPGLKGGTRQISGDEMEELLQRLPCVPTCVPGGAAANTAVGMARLGGRASLIAVVGNDQPGRDYTASIRQDGVGTEGFLVSSKLHTGKCLSLITPDSERTMRTYLGANADITPDDLQLSQFQGHSHLLMEGYTFLYRDVAIRVIELAKQADLKVCIDLNSPEIVQKNMDILPELMKEYFTAIFANEMEAAAFAGTSDESAALAALSDLCPIAIMKLGARGAVIKERNHDAIHVDAVKAKAIDTTGAGDSWAAGFFHAWLDGKSLEAAGKLGAKVSAEIVQVAGARLPDATWQSLKEYYNTLS